MKNVHAIGEFVKAVKNIILFHKSLGCDAIGINTKANPWKS